jgi:hypothetical protein
MVNSIPLIELLAHICVNSEHGLNPPRAPKGIVRQSLRKMFEPCLGARVGYAVEHLIVAAKAFDLVREDSEFLFAIIRPKDGKECQNLT